MIKERLPSQRQVQILDILINGRRYGREIRNEYENRTGRILPLGLLYTTLTRMETYGFVTSSMGEPSHERGGNRRKYFEITGPGQGSLDALERFNNNMGKVLRSA